MKRNIYRYLKRRVKKIISERYRGSPYLWSGQYDLSRVSNASGKKIISERYHGSPYLWSGQYDLSRVSNASGDFGYNGWGIYITTKKDYALDYAYDYGIQNEGYLYEFLFKNPVNGKLERFNSLSKATKNLYFINSYENLPLSMYLDLLNVARKYLEEKDYLRLKAESSRTRNLITIIKNLSKNPDVLFEHGARDFYEYIKNKYGKLGHYLKDSGHDTFVIYDPNCLHLLDISKHDEPYVLGRLNNWEPRSLNLLNLKPTRKEIDNLIQVVHKLKHDKNFRLYDPISIVDFTLLSVYVIRNKENYKERQSRRAAKEFLTRFYGDKMMTAFAMFLAKYSDFINKIYSNVKSHLSMKEDYQKISDIVENLNLTLSERDVRKIMKRSQQIKLKPFNQMNSSEKVTDAFLKMRQNVSYFKNLSPLEKTEILLACIDVLKSYKKSPLTKKKNVDLGLDAKMSAYVAKREFLPKGYEAILKEVQNLRYGNLILRYIELMYQLEFSGVKDMTNEFFNRIEKLANA